MIKFKLAERERDDGMVITLYVGLDPFYDNEIRYFTYVGEDEYDYQSLKTAIERYLMDGWE